MGEIERNARNGYSFIMDNGLTINTTGVKGRYTTWKY